MPQNTPYGGAIAQNSFAALLAKNWGLQAKLGGVTFENIPVVAGTPIKVLDTINGVNNGNLVSPLVGIAPGPGVLTSFWTTNAAPGSGATQNMLNGVVQIYIDGEATPSISFDVGGPLGWYQTTTTAQKVYTKDFMTETGGNANQFFAPICHNFAFPIPYQSSAVINFIPTQTSANFFFSTHYVSIPQHFPYKLFSQCTTFDNSIGVFPTGNQWAAAQLGNGSVRLLNVPGGSGYITAAWLYFLAGTASMGPLNCDINTYLNGNTPGNGYLTAAPDLTSGGIDGFFRYKWSSSSPQPVSTVQAAISIASATAGIFHGLINIAAMDGGWRFTNGAIMQIESGQAGNGGQTVSLGSGVLYYKDTP